MNERAVFLLPFWTERLLELEECSEWKRYGVRLERTARKTPFFLELCYNKIIMKIEHVALYVKDLEKANLRLEDAEGTAEKLKSLRKEFDDYKADVNEKATAERKKNAYKKLLADAGIPEKRHDAILKLKGFEGVEFDSDGKIKNVKELSEDINSEWADFIVTEVKKGAETANPPSNTGGNMTKEQILGIEDDAERQTAIAQNHELFGF